MKIKYDSEADAMYIRFRNGKFSKNKVIDRQTIIDFDKEGNMIGIEILRVSKRVPLKSLSEISVKNLIKISA